MGEAARMSERELEEFARARDGMEIAAAEKPRAAREGKPMTKAQANKLGKEMVAACVRGDQDAALALLEQGAQVNSRDDSGASCLAIALERCGKGVDLHAFAQAAVEAGGYVAPERYSGNASDFSEMVARGTPPGPSLKSDMVMLTLRAFISKSRRWAPVKAAHLVLEGAAGIEKALDGLARQKRADLLGQAAADGQAVPAACLERLAEGAELDLAASQSLFGPSAVASMGSLLAQMAKQGAVGDACAAKLFAGAAKCGSAAGIMALLGAGLRPAPDWRVNLAWVEKAGWRERTVECQVPLLVAAAASPGGRQAFDALKAFPPAVAAAKAAKPSPRALAHIQIAKLMELMELGVDISGSDEVGSLAHWWAKLDDKPRDGWAMLAARAPSIFDAVNGMGTRAAEAMAAKLGGADGDAFLASLSKIESREIRKEVKAPKASKEAPRRQRL